MSVALWQSTTIPHYACILRFAAKKQICLRLIKITNAVRMDLQWFTVRHTKSQPSSEPTDYGLITLDKSGLGGKTGVMVFLLSHVFPFEILKAKEQIGWFGFFSPIGSLGYIRSTILYWYTQTHRTSMLAWEKRNWANTNGINRAGFNEHESLMNWKT